MKAGSNPRLSGDFMPQPTASAIEFLAQRQSVPAKLITAPVPDADELAAILQAAMRVPDHGKLEPWRILVLERAALDRIADQTRAWLLQQGRDDETATKAALLFSGAPLIVAVVSSVVDSPKIPKLEQMFSAGNVCFGVVNNLLARGWAAAWQSGSVATDHDFLTRNLGLAAHEYVVGFVVAGTCTISLHDRPRPDLHRKVAWISA
jgi:nitroreductase